MSFSIINQNFLFWGGGVQKFPFLTTWPRKRAPPKHYRNKGFSTPTFEKQLCVTKRPFLDKKNQIQKFQLSFVWALFFSVNNKKHNNLLKPLLYSVLANLKNIIFQKRNLKQRNLKKKKRFLHSFFEKKLKKKRFFFGNLQKIGHKKHIMITAHKIA